MELLHHFFILLLCSVLNTDVYAKQKKAKSVTTLLDAKWTASPLVLEVAEYLSDENVDFFWGFVDSISSLDVSLNSLETDKEKYDTALSHASKFLTFSELNLLKLGLSLHIYSPKIEMFGQIAYERGLDCQTMVDIGGHLTCNLDDIESIVAKVRQFSRILSIILTVLIVAIEGG